MSESSPAGPGDVPPPRPPRSMRTLGMVVGVGYVVAVVALNLIFPALVVTGGLFLFGPLVALLVTAIVLAIIPRTASFGAGLLLSFGISLLIGAGICAVLVSRLG